MRLRGVTIVELLLTLTLLVIAGSGMVSGHFAAQVLNDFASEHMQAVNDLEDVLERIHATPWNELQGMFPAGLADGPPGNSYATLVGNYTLSNEQIIVTYPQQTPGRLTIQAIVTWTHRGRSRTAGLWTVRTEG